MNYGQIYGEIQANGFGTQMQPRCKLWANQAMHMICSAHRWSTGWC